MDLKLIFVSYATPIAEGIMDLYSFLFLFSIFCCVYVVCFFKKTIFEIVKTKILCLTPYMICKIRWASARGILFIPLWICFLLMFNVSSACLCTGELQTFKPQNSDVVFYIEPKVFESPICRYPISNCVTAAVTSRNYNLHLLENNPNFIDSVKSQADIRKYIPDPLPLVYKIDPNIFHLPILNISVTSSSVKLSVEPEAAVVENLQLKIHWLNELKTLQNSYPKLPFYNVFTRNHFIHPDLNIKERGEFLSLVQYLVGQQCCFTNNLRITPLDWVAFKEHIPPEMWQIGDRFVYQIMRPDFRFDCNEMGFVNVQSLNPSERDKLMHFWTLARFIKT